MMKSMRASTRYPLSPAGEVLKILAFPALLGAAIAAAMFWYAPGRETLLLPGIFLSVMATTVLLERMYPFEARWNSGWRESRQDAAYFLLTQPMVIGAELAATALGILVAMRLSNNVDVPLWPASLPLAIQIAIALLVSELPTYAYHRASHQSNGFLWRVHAVHHAPGRVYSFNFIRLHPVNSFASTFLGLLPLALLGVPGKVIFVAAVVQKSHALLSHANFDFRLGPLNWIFSMAELHRWHHARDIRLANANYGATLIVWDVLFGTRALPCDDIRRHELGVQNPAEVPTGFCKQICGAFRPGPAG
jgi:sterol desaturase/sphingolipid hydroxylase (fatty acid hydroxylase superfamily)